MDLCSAVTNSAKPGCTPRISQAQSETQDSDGKLPGGRVPECTAVTRRKDENTSTVEQFVPPPILRRHPRNQEELRPDQHGQ